MVKMGQKRYATILSRTDAVNANKGFNSKQFAEKIMLLSNHASQQEPRINKTEYLSYRDF